MRGFLGSFLVLAVLSSVLLSVTDCFVTCKSIAQTTSHSILDQRSHRIAVRSYPMNRMSAKTFSDTSVLATTIEQDLPVKATNGLLSSVQNLFSSNAKLFDRLEVVFYLSLWYLFSAVYNIYNKKALNALALPWFVATVQMGTGLLLFIPLWLLKFREFPTTNYSELLEVFGYMKSVALYQTLTHISGVIALGSGVVSFTQVVKASEPVFTSAISALFLKEYLPWQVYMTLIPVCIGVAVASTTELSFSWYCLLAGIVANIFAAARGVFGKTQMCGETSCLEQLSPENYYAILTILSFFMLVPATILIEGRQIYTVFKSAAEYFSLLLPAGALSNGKLLQSASGSIVNRTQFNGLLYSLFSGILFYLYNEVSFRTLNKVHPVTHAVSNTVKRIVIILSSVIVFNNKMTATGIFGTCLAISGVFLYSISQYVYKPKVEKTS